MDKETKININDAEIALIKQTFCDNELFLQSIRALMIGLEVTEEEKQVIKTTFANPELRAIMWKRFYPQIDKKTPIGQIQDVWLGVEQMIFAQSKDVIYQAIQYKEVALNMTVKALALLENPDGERVNVTNYSPNNVIDEHAIHLLARNQFLRHIETQLTFLSVIAGKKEETTEEAKTRMTKNSAK